MESLGGGASLVEVGHKRQVFEGSILLLVPVSFSASWYSMTHTPISQAPTTKDQAAVAAVMKLLSRLPAPPVMS